MEAGAGSLSTAATVVFYHPGSQAEGGTFTIAFKCGSRTRPTIQVSDMSASKKSWCSFVPHCDPRGHAPLHLAQLSEFGGDK